MKVLWLGPGLLLPLDKGGKLRTWHLMRHLAGRHDITYLGFADPATPREHIDGMREVCRDLHVVQRVDPAKGTWRFYADAARYLVDPVPYAVAKYRSEEYRRRAVDLLRDGRFDVAVCDFLVPSVNLPDRLPCPGVLFTHNVETEIWRRHAAAARNPITAALLRTQWRRMERFERAALSRFDLILAVSEADAATLTQLERRPSGGPSHPAPRHVVQTGVDTTYFTPAEKGRQAHLVFTGSMDWLPNEDGILYFVREILPRIREAEPGVSLSVVGRAPTPAIRRLAADAGIEVTGRVDDVRPHIADAAVYVVPLRIGGGTRLKIFEAMAMAKAVVSTTIGAEGLPVTPGADIVIADEPERFAGEVVRLIRDRAARQRLEHAARQLVVERYDWAAVAQDIERALEVAGGRAPAADRSGSVEAGLRASA